MRKIRIFPDGTLKKRQALNVIKLHEDGKGHGPAFPVPRIKTSRLYSTFMTPFIVMA